MIDFMDILQLSNVYQIIMKSAVNKYIITTIVAVNVITFVSLNETALDRFRPY